VSERFYGAPIKMSRRSTNQPREAKPFIPLVSNHVSERFYVVHLIDGTYELFRHFYRVKGFASRGLVGLF
jgi:hypothetical protein